MRALLTGRCPACHNPFSLLAAAAPPGASEADGGGGGGGGGEDRDAVYAASLGALAPARQATLAAVWDRFRRGRARADAIVGALVRACVDARPSSLSLSRGMKQAEAARPRRRLPLSPFPSRSGSSIR